jgi:hypothetical protein
MRGEYQSHRVIAQRIGDDHLFENKPQRHDALTVHDLRHFRRVRERGAAHDFVQLGAIEIRHVELEHEAVELRLGQRIGPFLLERILRRQNEERLLADDASCPRR